MKRNNFLLSVFAALVAMLPLGAYAQDSGVRGDVNGDGKVSIADVTAVINYLLSGDDSAIDLSAADVDDNGVVKISDVTALIYILLGNSYPYFPETVTLTANGVSFTMVYVAPGTFMMGATDKDGSDATEIEFPSHQVTLTRGFYISQTEVTYELWEAVMGTTALPASGPSDYPATMMSDMQAVIFCSSLGFLGKDFYLPTEAEWEYAARGGHKSEGYKYAGSDNVDEVAWYKDNSGGTSHPVGQKKPNELGLYDMSGNVNEWCRDIVDFRLGSYPSDPQTDPCVQDPIGLGGYRIARGGTNGLHSAASRVAARRTERSLNMQTGFRFIFYVD